MRACAWTGQCSTLAPPQRLYCKQLNRHAAAAVSVGAAAAAAAVSAAGAAVGNEIAHPAAASRECAPRQGNASS
jgi:hypothetical protein